MKNAFQALMAYTIPSGSAALIAQYNPFPSHTAASWLFTCLAGLGVIFVSLRWHPNGVNGPAAPSAPGAGIVTSFAAALLMGLSVSGCGAANALKGDSLSATVDGQTVTVSIMPDGTVCSSYAPPITYLGESCSVACQTMTFPFLNLTCASAVTGALHTVHLVQQTVPQAPARH